MTGPHRAHPWLVYIAALTGITSSALAADSYELKYHFQRRGKPYIHGFVLTWSGPESNLQSISVIDPESGNVVQKIVVPQDRVKLIWKDVQTGQAGTTKESLFEQLDYNFDRFADIRLLREYPPKATGKLYLVYIFDKKKNQFVLHEDISALPGLTINQKNGRLESTTLGGFGGFESTTQHFAVTPFGKLVLEAREESKVIDALRMTIQKEVYTRQEGDFKLVCQWIEEPEGAKRPRVGTPEICNKYWTPPKPKKGK